MWSFHRQEMKRLNEMKRWAVLFILGGLCATQVGFAQILEPPTAIPELDPVILLEQNPAPIPSPVMLEQPVNEQNSAEPIDVEQITTQQDPSPEQSMTKPPLPPSVGEPIIPTLSSDPPVSASDNNPAVSTKPLISTPLVSTKVGIGHCHYASQLNLTSNQKFRLKHSKDTFAQENRAAFDSLRIKRNLLKRLGNNPESAREKEQREQLQKEIREELQMLKAKREAQINHVLTPEQSDQLQALKADCQPQGQSKLQKINLFNLNSPERQLSRTIRNIPKKKL